MDSDLSSNRCTSPLEGYEIPTRHSSLCFEDGNLCIVVGQQYFIVHRGILSRHSDILHARIEAIRLKDEPLMDGLGVLHLDDSPGDFARFLQALYG